jgi:hypothetical protein
LFEETAYLAYYFHWPLDQILDLEHPIRQRFIAEVSSIHEQMQQS